MALSLFPVPGPTTAPPSRIVFVDHAVAANIIGLLATAGYTVPSGSAVQLKGWGLQDGSVVGAAYFLLLAFGARVLKKGLVNSVTGSSYVEFKSDPCEVDKLRGDLGQDLSLGFNPVVASAIVNGYIEIEIVKVVS